MRLFRKSCLIICSLLLAVSVLMPLSAVHAADQQWINQIWSEYKSYNKKTVNAYNAYQKQVDKKYKQFYDASQASLNQLEKKVLDDQKQWNETLQADLSQLKLRYEGNRDLNNKLTQYERYINPHYLNSPMWKYKNAADRHYLNSTLWRLSKQVDEHYLNSWMWRYKKAIDPHYLNSPAWRMKNTVSESYLNSSMWKLKNASSSSYLNSPMWKYARGKISKATAKNQYSKLFKAYTAELSESNADRKSEIASMEKEAQKSIDQLYKDTVLALETRREETLQSISDLRIEITGEGLQWEALLVEKP
ncbi:hypothetical protein [Paenibacillus solani]|uniref:Uncharacterized protein n=1 Tax=Paenibacillus solani TaxID=1705565 RepID=A0A0M1P140_9BACL|nr:hypothetical protein [Paenibacillus solani]KOR87975.1 hypothetical protein AM231_01690 [Paenibacillus solani]